MMVSQRSMRIVLTIGLGLPALAAQVQAQPTGSCSVPSIDARQVCAVESVVQARQGIPYEHDGKTYWVCCPRCVEAFKAHPEAYRLATDPVSGQQVEKATALVQPYADRVFYFASETSRAAFNKEPERWAQ